MPGDTYQKNARDATDGHQLHNFSFWTAMKSRVKRIERSIDDIGIIYSHLILRGYHCIKVLDILLEGYLNGRQKCPAHPILLIA